MSSRQAKKLRKEARKEAVRLLVDANTSLMRSLAQAPFWERLKFCAKVLFR